MNTTNETTLTTTETILDVTDRDTAIAEIKKALKARSGKAWSVRGGKGTAWGWIQIHSLPARRVEYGYMSEEDRKELSALLDMEVHNQGVSIAASGDYRKEYVARARGAEPQVIGRPYWD